MPQRNVGKLTQILEKNFSKSDKAKLYFVKGLKKYSNTFIVKTAKSFDDNNLDQIKNILRKELSDPAIELLRWIDTVDSLIPRKNIYRTPFFDTENIKEYNPWRVCSIGEHWVRRHDRQKKYLEDVDGHCRKNRSKKDLLMGDEIELISQHELFKNAKIKVSSSHLGFYENGNKFDDLISGWTAYWNDVFKLDNPLHPNFVKALIATESSFLSNSKSENKSKRIGQAKGLVQITEATYRSLKDLKGELRDHFVELEEEELWEANKNICAAVRWLFRKRETTKAKLKREPTWEEVLWDYKGRLKSQTEETQEIKNKIKNFLKQME